MMGAVVGSQAFGGEGLSGGGGKCGFIGGMMSVKSIHTSKKTRRLGIQSKFFVAN
jgi:delta 1-pyrroline-5-carboxylate dehydrogenase